MSNKGFENMNWWRFVIHLLSYDYFPEPQPDPENDLPTPEPDPEPKPPEFDWSSQDKAIIELLALIGSVEAPKGYNQLSGFAEAKIGRHTLTEMTLQEVEALQTKAIGKGSKSSAMGRYQFIRATFRDVVKTLKLDWNTKFTPKVQDRMAWYLLEKRGLKDFIAKRKTAESFANSLAMEWAAFPVVNDMQGHVRFVKAGQSYYSGDGLNAAHLPPATVLAALRKINPAAQVNVA